MAFDLDVVFARKVVFVTGVVLPRVFILIADIKIGKTISTYAVALQLIFYILMLWAGVPVYIEMLITLLLLREERATEDHGRPVFQADPLLSK